MVSVIATWIFLEV